MPAYYTVSFQYERATLDPNYLSAVYSAMLQGGFTYGGVLAWGCRGDMGLDEVIRWNQERLDRDFELGYTEDVSNDYRQVLLHHPQYRECRVLILNGSRLISVIVPEADIMDIGGPFPAELYIAEAEGLAGYIRQEQLEPLKQLALAVWNRVLPVSVQTYGELGSETDHEALKAGEPPSLLPFALVRNGWGGVERLAKQGIHITPVGETGILMARMSQATEPGTA